MTRRASTVVLLVCLIGVSGSAAAQPRARLSAETVAAFNGFTAAIEQFIDSRIRERRPFLAEGSAEQRREVVNGAIVIDALGEPPLPNLPGGLGHVWAGLMFVPGATVADVLTVLQDYDRHQEWYEEAVDSRTLGRRGDTIRGFLRLRKTQVLTAVLNTEHDAIATELADGRWAVRSHSTRIAEVRNPGEPDEEELPVGYDSGFLWRLNAYWLLDPEDHGVFVECVSVSLTRSVPWGLGFIINPIIRDLPRESLEATLESTRSAVRGLR